MSASNRNQQPENFDSTAKLMLEALAKASAELEKSVTAYTEHLISFKESIQKALEEELRATNTRLEGCIRSNLDDLGHAKHLMMRRLLEAERQELDALSDAGRQVRASIGQNARQIEEKIESFIAAQITELKEFLQQPQAQIEAVSKNCRTTLQARSQKASSEINERQQEYRRRLSDKVNELERNLKLETNKAREAVSAVGEFWNSTLTSEREAYCSQLGKLLEETLGDVEKVNLQGNQDLERTEKEDCAMLEEAGEQWKEQINSHAASFNQLINNLGAVLKENFDTKLANVADQSRQEITLLSDQAHEKIAGTRSELEVELQALEKDYLHQLDTTLQKLEGIVVEHFNDKRNSNAARQRKAQKAREQMQVHLKRWGASLIDSIKDASTHFENEFSHATDGFHLRIEGARVSAIELLERESKLMQKDLDRVLKEFQRELSEVEVEIGKIESAGQDAVVTVIACRKAMLSFKGE